MPELEKKLRSAADKLQGWKTQLALLLALLSVSGLLLLLTYLDGLSPMQEKTVLAILLGIAAFGLVILVGQFLFNLLNAPKHTTIARKVESDHPELLDVYNCAVDLLERKKPEELNSMEKRVLEEAAKRTSEIPLAQSILPKPNIRTMALVGIAASCAFLVYSKSLPSVQKAINSWTDISNDTVSGLSVQPGNDEFPRGSDVAVHAHIYRGVREASIEYRVGEGALQKEPMRLRAGLEVAPMEFKILDSVKDGHGSILETTIPHGIAKGQAVQLSGDNEWSAGIHRVIEADGKHLVILKNIPANSGEISGKVLPLQAQEFYFYGIKDTVNYRVVTPELTGAWHELTSYIPPSIEKATWKITPPAYTQVPVSEQDGFQPIRMPEGSLLELEVLGEPPESTTYLVRGDNQLEIDGELGKWFHQWIPSEETTYSVLIRSKDNREFQSKPVALEIIKDEPPIVEIRKPAKDQQLKLDQFLAVEAFAVDDYGLLEARLQVRLPGGIRSETMPIKPIQKEKILRGSLKLSELVLEVGDYFSYYVEVADNRPNDPQWARSGIYFIEIIPPDQEPMEGNEGPDPKEIPLRNLINENKRLLRETYTGTSLEQPDRMEQSRKVANIAHELEKDMNRLYSENKEKLPGALGELLQSATKSIHEGQVAATKDQLDETLAHSEDSLRNLVKMSAMLRRPPTKSKKPSKSKSEGEGESQQNKEQSKEQQPPNLAEQFQKMQEDLAAARDLLKQQNALNPQVSRNASTGRKGAANTKLAEKQDNIAQATRDLRNRIYDRTGKFGFAEPLDQAEEEMGRVSGDLNEDQPAEAQPHGLRASEALEQSVKTMENALRQLGNQMVQGLAQKSKELAKEQKGLQQSTESASKGEGGPLKNEQQRINNDANQLLSAMSQVARALESVSPRANEALFQAASEARKGGIEKAGKRAENALNYEIFKKAMREQEKISRELDKTSDSLEDIQRKLANESNELLQQLLKDLAQSRRGMPGMNAEELQQTRQEIANQLGQLEATAKYVQLQNIMQQLQHGKFSDQIQQNIGATNEILGQTQQILQSFLWQDALKESMTHNRETTAPPRKYKGQVQEYFRRLAEGTL